VRIVRRPAQLLVVAAVILLGVAAGASGDPPRAAEPSVHYTVRSDAALETLSVRVCFDDAPPGSLGPGVEAAGRALLDALHDGEPLPVRRGRVVLSSLSAGDCVDYRVDLDTARRASRFSGRPGRDFVSSQGVWLWRDRSHIPEGGATIRFDLPDGVHAATPWPERPDGSQHLGPTAFRRPSFIAFAHEAPIATIERQGVRATLTRLDDGWDLSDADLERWLTEAIDGISLVQGRFPVDSLSVIVVPSGGRGMGFGMVRRGGGFSAMYLVGRRSTLDDLRDSWVTWHELSHLHLPALPQRDAWLYEGLATYYQEVIPARLGVQPDREAWRQLLAGLERGQRARARGTLTGLSEDLRQNRAYSRVYWAGTAFALEADVRLRERGSSLDEALRRAAPRWRNDLSVYSSERVCAAWDRPLDAAVLRPLRDRYAGARGFPATADLLSRLGVSRSERSVSLTDAELSRVRDAIMRVRQGTRPLD